MYNFHQRNIYQGSIQNVIEIVENRTHFKELREMHC